MRENSMRLRRIVILLYREVLFIPEAPRSNYAYEKEREFHVVKWSWSGRSFPIVKWSWSGREVVVDAITGWGQGLRIFPVVKKRGGRRRAKWGSSKCTLQLGKKVRCFPEWEKRAAPQQKKKTLVARRENVCCVEGVSRGSVFIASFPAVLGGVALRPVIINPTSG